MSKLDSLWDAIMFLGMAFRGVYYWGIPIWVFAGVFLLGAGLYVYYHKKFKRRESRGMEKY
ncbi:hypothetical protein [Bacillus sp. SJS]|uniref:hypothetical protein n=1 Tax=Bacillus sp. SJS TaxID=1423321 RepID=UPI0004DCF165|nr:hypothetical protein [Bacillus sp. SJS]KZZ86159.1 hypothetical protein AS29_000860 [Bacillus sp. SJS]